MSGLFTPVSAMRAFAAGAPPTAPTQDFWHYFERGAADGDYADAADSVSLSPTGSFSVEMRVKFDSFPTAGQYLVCKSGAAGNQSWQMYYSGTNSQLYFETWNSADGRNAYRTNEAGGLGLVIGQEYHFAFVQDVSGSGTKHIYIDGAAPATALALIAGAADTDIKDSTAPVEIGALGGVSTFDGLIGDVRIWSGVRTVTEVNDNKAADLNPASEPNLKALWFKGATYNDETSNNNDLTVYDISAEPNAPGFVAYNPTPLLLDLDFTEPNQQAFPTAAGSVLAGYTASEIYRFEETSGNAVGDVSSTPLTPVSLPTQGAIAAGFYDGTDLYSKKCAAFPRANVATFDAASSAVFDQGTASFAALFVYRGQPHGGSEFGRLGYKLTGTTGWLVNLSSDRLYAYIGSGSGLTGVNTNVGASDGAWHAGLAVWDRTANTLRIYTDFDTEKSISIAGVSGSISNSDTFQIGNIATAANSWQIGYWALFEGAQVETMGQSDLDAFWTHGKVNTTPIVTYARTGIATTTVGSEPGFGLRVASWSDDQLPIGHNAGFGHASKLAASFYDAVTNQVTYSQALDDADWATTNLTVTADSGEAPDGTLTADTLTADLANGFIESKSYTVAVNDDTTASMFVRRVGGTNVTGRLIIYDVTGAAEEAAVAFTATAEWQRVRVHNANAASTSQAIRIEVDTSGEAVEAWGVQAEEGADTVTPYVPTDSTAATRGDASGELNNIGGSTYYESTSGELSVVHLSDYQMTNDLLTMVSAMIRGTSENDRRDASQTRFAYEKVSVYKGDGAIHTLHRNTGSQSVGTEYEHRIRWDEAAGLTGGVRADAWRNATKLTTYSGTATDSLIPGNGATKVHLSGNAATLRRNGLVARVRIWDVPRADVP